LYFNIFVKIINKFLKKLNKVSFPVNAYYTNDNKAEMFPKIINITDSYEDDGIN